MVYNYYLKINRALCKFTSRAAQRLSKMKGGVVGGPKVVFTAAMPDCQQCSQTDMLIVLNTVNQKSIGTQHNI